MNRFSEHQISEMNFSQTLTKMICHFLAEKREYSFRLFDKSAWANSDKASRRNVHDVLHRFEKISLNLQRSGFRAETYSGGVSHRSSRTGNFSSKCFRFHY